MTHSNTFDWFYESNVVVDLLNCVRVQPNFLKVNHTYKHIQLIHKNVTWSKIRFQWSSRMCMVFLNGHYVRWYELGSQLMSSHLVATHCHMAVFSNGHCLVHNKWHKEAFDGFTLGMISISIAYLSSVLWTSDCWHCEQTLYSRRPRKGTGFSIYLSIYQVEVNIYIGSWALRLRCTQYGLYGLGGLHECKDNPISNLSGPGNVFQLVLKKFV